MTSTPRSEQRLYVDKALAVLGAAGGARALASDIAAEFAAIEAPPPSAAALRAAGYATVPAADWAAPMAVGGYTVAFDPASGALQGSSFPSDTLLVITL